jgi:hypothetical protein
MGLLCKPLHTAETSHRPTFACGNLPGVAWAHGSGERVTAGHPASCDSEATAELGNLSMIERGFWSVERPSDQRSWERGEAVNGGRVEAAVSAHTTSGQANREG